MRALLVLVGALAVLAACASVPEVVDNDLARARTAPDYATFKVRRVGLMPLDGKLADGEPGRVLQAALAGALARDASFEVVVLEAADLDEIPGSEVFRHGWSDPRTVLAIARRYRLDALLVGTVTELQSFAPQRLSAELDLIAVETGLSIWSASLHADAAHDSVQKALERWHADQCAGGRGGESLELYRISPRRFAEFCMAQVTDLL
jgi:hypothetical protein